MKRLRIGALIAGGTVLLGLCLVGVAALFRADSGNDQDPAAKKPGSIAVVSPEIAALGSKPAAAKATAALSPRGTKTVKVVADQTMTEPLRQALANYGARVIGPTGPREVLVEATPAVTKRIAADARFSTEDIAPSSKVEPQLAGLCRKDPNAKLPVAVLGLAPEDCAAIASWVVANGGTLREGMDVAEVLYAEVTPAMVSALSERGDVRFIEYDPPAQVVNDRSVVAKAANVDVVRQLHGLRGKGQTVAIYDSGFDTGDKDNCHLDFTNRVVAVINEKNCAEDYCGHGTHCAGTILGDGTRSDGQYKGVAPEAQLFAQGGGDTAGSTSIYTPGTPEHVFASCLDYDSYIQSDSWGSDTAGAYNTRCNNIDYVLWSHPELLIVVACGNAGKSGMSTVGSPAAAKNVLTVGNCYSARSGDPENLNVSSSRGPTADNRIKPDITAPGTYIISARSSLCKKSAIEGNSYYTQMTGTSMATPLVAGSAALVRQWLQECRGYTSAQPTAALLKAILTGGAVDMSGKCSSTSIPAAPNNYIGWGRINLGETLFPTDGTAVTYRDRIPFSNGSVQTFDIVTTNTAPLRVQLCWTDYSALAGATKTLINDLDLVVSNKTTHAIWYGNDTIGGDHTNTTESVRIDSAPAGEYTVIVKGTSISYSSTKGGAAAVYVKGAFKDEMLSVVASTKAVTLAEGGTTSLGFRLSDAPEENVTVTIGVQASQTITLSKTSLTFTPSNWSTMQTVDVTFEDDSAIDPSTITIACGKGTFNAANGSFSKLDLTPAYVTVTPIDNERPVTIAAETLSATTNSVAYSVSLSSFGMAGGVVPSSASVTVTLYSGKTGTTAVGSDTKTLTAINTPASFSFSGLEAGAWYRVVTEVVSAPQVTLTTEKTFRTQICDESLLIDLTDDLDNRAGITGSAKYGATDGSGMFDGSFTEPGDYIGGSSPWVVYEFKEKMVVNAIGLMATTNRSVSTSYMGTVFSLYASDDYDDITNAAPSNLLLSLSETDWTYGEVRRFLVDNETAYKYYRLTVNRSASSSTAYQQEAEFYELGGSANPTTVSVAAGGDAYEATKTSGSFVISRSADSAISSAIIVHYSVTGTAVAGQTYEALSGTVTIPARQYSVTVPVVPMYDGSIREDSTVVVTIDALSTYQIGTGSATIKVVDGGLLGVSVAAGDDADYSTSHNGSFIFSRPSGAPTVYALTVPYTVSGTAVAGTGYTALSGTVTIPAGESSVTVPVVPLFADVTVDTTVTVTIPDESFDVGTGTASITVKGIPVSHVSIVAGADATSSSKGSFTVTRRAGDSTASALVVSYTVSGTGAGYIFALSGTVTIPAGAMSTTIEILANNAGGAAKTLTLTLGSGEYFIDSSSASVTIGANAAAEHWTLDTTAKTISWGGWTFGATINSTTARTITVNYPTVYPSVASPLYFSLPVFDADGNTYTIIKLNCNFNGSSSKAAAPYVGELTLPGEGLTGFGYGAFADCTNATGTIVFPSTFTDLGGSAPFTNCRKLTIVGSSMASIEKVGAGFNGVSFEGEVCLPLVEEIISGGFANSNLHSIRFGKALKRLGRSSQWSSGCFANCKSLTNVVFDADSKVALEYGETFYGCTSLQNLDLSSVTNFTCGRFIYTSNGTIRTNVNNGVFYNCSALTNVTFGADINFMASNVFHRATGLKSVHFKGLPPTQFEMPYFSLAVKVNNVYPTVTTYVPRDLIASKNTSGKCWNDYAAGGAVASSGTTFASQYIESAVTVAQRPLVYEEPEDTNPAPSISSVVLSNITTNSVTVTVSGSNLNDGEIAVAVTNAQGTAVSLQPLAAFGDSCTITGLTPNTVYAVVVYASNTAGSATPVSKTFTTLDDSEYYKVPVISSVVVSGISDKGATITVSGSDLGTGSFKVEIYNSAMNLVLTTESVTGWGSIKVTGLDSETSYYARAIATHGTSHKSATSEDIAFTTIAAGANWVYDSTAKTICDGQWTFNATVSGTNMTVGTPVDDTDSNKCPTEVTALNFAKPVVDKSDSSKTYSIIALNTAFSSSKGDNVRTSAAYVGELTLPDTLQTTGLEAFGYCVNMTGDLVIPASITSLGSGTFRNTGISTVVFKAAKNATIGGGYCRGMFMQCTSLVSVKFAADGSYMVPDGNMFDGCTALVDADLSGVKCVSAGGPGYSVFYNCSAITNVTLDSELVVTNRGSSGTIGNALFRDYMNKKLASVHFTGAAPADMPRWISGDSGYLGCIYGTQSVTTYVKADYVNVKNSNGMSWADYSASGTLNSTDSTFGSTYVASGISLSCRKLLVESTPEPVSAYEAWTAEKGLTGDDAAWDAKPTKWGGKLANAFVYTYGEGLVDNTTTIITISFDTDGNPVVTTPAVIDGHTDFTPAVIGVPTVTDWTTPIVLEATGNNWKLPSGKSANFFRVRITK